MQIQTTTNMLCNVVACVELSAKMGVELMQSDGAIECSLVHLDKEWQGTLDRMNSVFTLRATHTTSNRYSACGYSKNLNVVNMFAPLSFATHFPSKKFQRVALFLDVNSVSII
jgi:hypothetical protein